MKRIIIISVLASLLMPGLFSEVSTKITLTQLAGIARGFDDDVLLTGMGLGNVSFSSVGNKNVKAELSINAQIGDTAILDIDKAYVKARFPLLENSNLRATVGKTRLSWGDGFFFNAGDILFGSTNPLADLTADEIRTNNAWLGALFLPVGRFSFFETVIVPPQFDLRYEYIQQSTASETEPYLPELPLAETVLGGGRFQTKILEVKTETGYLYNGDSKVHRPYISAQGNVYLDWYAAASTSLNAENYDNEEWMDNSQVSFGLYHIAKPTRDITLNLRLEGLITPEGSWEEKEDISSPATLEDYYGIYLYPEISAGLPGNRNSFIRAVYSPIDSSGLGTVGFAWNIYQGFSLLAYASAQFGEESDQFSFKRPNGYSVSIGCKFIY